MRWILLDRFVNIERGVHARALKHITRAESALIGDFPHVPMMPSSLMIEMMAQVAGVLVGATIEFAKEVIIAKVAEARFHAPCTPPAALVIDGWIDALGGHDALTHARITSDGEVIAEATIMFGLLESLVPQNHGPVVFSREFMESFNIRQIVGGETPA